MPRNYIKKKVESYTQNDMARAVDAVAKNEMSIYAASKKFCIPTTTLFDRIKAKTSTSIVGRPLAIPFLSEKRLADAIAVMEKWGFGLTRQEILEIVGEYVKKNNLNTPFTNDIPGPDWFINFRKRHKLSIKKPQPVEYLRKKMTDPFIIDEFFTLLEKTLADLDLYTKPESIWNLDETSLSLDPTKTKVVGKINKPCSRTTCGTGKENITVLTAVSATGAKISPLIVFKGKQMWDQWMAKSDDFDFEISYASSSKGWMETTIFYNYMDKILIPALGKERPVLLIYDGHSTHVDANVVELAIKNNITILKLPPHTSHLLQPLDVAVFKSFKSKWDRKLVEWQRHNIGRKMPKNVFAQTFGETWQETDVEVIQNGFKKTGIYPMNKKVISEDIYDPVALRRFKEKEKSSACLQTHIKPSAPKSLVKLCIDIFNEKFRITHCTSEEIQTHCASVTQNTDYDSAEVTLVSKISKNDEQSLAFVANHISELPHCLREEKDNENSSKIDSLKTNKVSFEELVLERIRQDKSCTTLKKKRVAKGAEVITQTLLKNNIEKEKLEVHNKQTQKLKGKSKSKIKLTPNSNVVPGYMTEYNMNNAQNNETIRYSKKSTSKRKLETETKSGHEINKRSSISSAKISSKIKSDVEEVNEHFSDFDIMQWADTDVLHMNDILENEIISRDLNKENVQFDIIETESQIENFQQIKNKQKGCRLDTEHENIDKESMMEILDEKTGCMRTVVVTTATIETRESPRCKFLLTEKIENFANSVDNQIEGLTNSKKSIKKHNTKPKKKKKCEDSITTSEEDIISIHSDSDIVDFVQNTWILDDESEDGDVIRTAVNKKEAAIWADIMRLDEIDKTVKPLRVITEPEPLQNKITISHEDRHSDENMLTATKKNLRCNKRNIITNQKPEVRIKQMNDKKNECKDKSTILRNEVNDSTIVKYNLKETVLVRYYEKKKWKYYVGLIKEINNKDLERKYGISFYKSVQRNNILKFVKPKRPDEDFVSIDQIVKEIEMIQIGENPEEYVLNDEKDEVYF